MNEYPGGEYQLVGGGTVEAESRLDVLPLFFSSPLTLSRSASLQKSQAVLTDKKGLSIVFDD